MAGYYNGSYYVEEGVSDAQRTQNALNYYKQNNMTDQYNNALNYANSKGYSTTGGVSTTAGLGSGATVGANAITKNAAASANTNTNTNTVQTPTGNAGQDMNIIWRNIQDQLNNIASSMKPATTTTDYSSVLADLKSSTAAAHAEELENLKRDVTESEGALMSSMADAGAYDSSTRDKRLAQLKGDWLDQEAEANATYESNMATLANSVYQAGISRDSAAQSTYNNIVAQLASMYMNGTLSLAQFASNQAYQQALLARLMTNDYMSQMS